MQEQKTIIITGITGQVGSILAEELLKQGHSVHGVKRRGSSFNTQRLDHVFDDPNLKLHYGDILDFSSISKLVNELKPDYFYHFSCQSHVKVSFDMPIYSVESVVMGTLNCLEAVKQFSPTTRFLHSGSSEQFGGITFPQSEQTPYIPRSPYAVGKVAACNLVKNYREAYGLFAVSSICFNMESSNRLDTFVTRKITRAATRIKEGLQNELQLGNLNAKRDWNHPKDSIRAMQLMLETDNPNDYVIGSGNTRSVKEFVEIVFGKLGLNWNDYVKINSVYFRPTEVDVLQADSSLIQKELGWKPEISFEQLVDEMIENDLKLAKQEKLLKDIK